MRKILLSICLVMTFLVIVFACQKNNSVDHTNDAITLKVNAWLNSEKNKLHFDSLDLASMKANLDYYETSFEGS
jgi:hypothetical protein